MPRKTYNFTAIKHLEAIIEFSVEASTLAEAAARAVEQLGETPDWRFDPAGEDFSIREETPRAQDYVVDFDGALGKVRR